MTEWKRLEQKIGSLHKINKVQILVEQCISSSKKSISINSDQQLFCRSINDMKLAKSASNVIPILVHDLTSNPYQLWRLWLASTDAMRFLVWELIKDYKDLFYFLNIVESLKIQTVLSVATKAQLQNVTHNIKNSK